MRLRASIVLFAAMALLAAGSQLWIDRKAGERCVVDGVAVQPAFAVDWIAEREPSRALFCTIACARRWSLIAAPLPPGRFVVRDGATGEPLAAEIAYFIETPSAPAGRSNNFTRAFGSWQDALKCQQSLEGRVVPNPLAGARGPARDEQPPSRSHQP